MKKHSSVKGIILYLLGLGICTVPVVVAILSYFPLWAKAKDGSAVSGIVLILLLLAFKPIFNLLKKAFKTSAAYTMWLVVFVVFFALSRIADQITVISFVGLVSNALGALVIRLSCICEKRGA